jgi:hypothetical protein
MELNELLEHLNSRKPLFGEEEANLADNFIKGAKEAGHNQLGKSV